MYQLLPVVAEGCSGEGDGESVEALTLLTFLQVGTVGAQEIWKELYGTATGTDA